MTTWYESLILVRPRRVLANLERTTEMLGVPQPTPWQLCLGVLRLWHRVLFRSSTVGTSPGGIVRSTLRARVLAWRAARLPCLLAERAVVPLDFTGLGSTPERLITHLLGAHHDGNQFVYDLELLAAYGKLDELRQRVRDVIDRDDTWLRDLTVFEGYHESLLAAVERAIAAGPERSEADARDPDISLHAYLTWCSQQPATPAETLRAWHTGAFQFDTPLADVAKEAVAC